MHLSALTAFRDNYIWMLQGGDGTVLLVDPGEAAPVFSACSGGLTPTTVLLTHHHPDHCAGVPALLQRWPQLQVFAPEDARIGTATHRVGQDSVLRFGNLELVVHAVPGHTSSHVAFHGGGHLFCGDTLFSLGCGRLFEGTPAQMLDSLERLAALPGETAVCCGHEYTLANAAFARAVEPINDALRRRTEEARTMRTAGRPTLPCTLASERATNPFLRTGTPAVRSAVAARLGRDAADAVETFAELRRWKDGFST